MNNPNEEFLRIQEEKQKLFEAKVESIKREVSKVFTPDQSELITNIFINQLKLEQEQEEAGQAYVTLSSTIEAFYKILVLDQNLISRETFDEVASKILSDNVNAITEYLEQQESK